LRALRIAHETFGRSNLGQSPVSVISRHCGFSDMLSLRYHQFSGLSCELLITHCAKDTTQCYSHQRLIPFSNTSFQRLHTHSSTRTQRGLEAHIQHSVVLSLYPLNVAVQSHLSVFGDLPLSCHAIVPQSLSPCG